MSLLLAVLATGVLASVLEVRSCLPCWLQVAIVLASSAAPDLMDKRGRGPRLSSPPRAARGTSFDGGWLHNVFGAGSSGAVLQQLLMSFVRTACRVRDHNINVQVIILNTGDRDFRDILFDARVTNAARRCVLVLAVAVRHSLTNEQMGTRIA